MLQGSRLYLGSQEKMASIRQIEGTKRKSDRKNSMERRRVRILQEAFERLRNSIPYCDESRLRTRRDVLRRAAEYIQLLEKMVKASSGEQNESQIASQASGVS